MVTVISVDKKNQFAREIVDYGKRLRAPFNMEWVLLANSTKTGNSARISESSEIMRRISVNDFVILLDERGNLLSSESFAKMLADKFSGAATIKIIIGGAYGVDERLRARANKVISLSRMTLPHQIVRLLLVEQIYRSQCIQGGHPYHHA